MKMMRVIAVVLMLALLLCSCSANKKVNTPVTEELQPASSLTIDEEEAAVLNEKVPVCLYFGDEQQTKLVKEIRYVDIKEAKKGASALASAIVKELLAGPKAKGLKAVIAQGTTLRSPVKIEGRVATVDLTKEFVDNHPGGKALAELTVYSIVNSLTEMKEIERVKIIINGKETKKFKDNVTLNSDFPRNDAVVNKEVGLARPEDGELVPVTVPEDADSAQISGEQAEDPLE
ncbi:MAG: GerMN domain-containing protein [Clostridia bacterium]|nr:GerMN domain-containing protein [Clostridia bacterium]